MVATISADIIRSTSLQTEDLINLRNRLRRLLDAFEMDYSGFWARIVRGDSIECYVPDFRYALRIAILMKLFVKIQTADYKCHAFLRKYGIRFSIGIAGINYSDKVEDIIDGPAIYLSGRNLDEISRDNSNIAFEIDEAPETFNNLLESYVALLSNIVDTYSSKQAEVIFYKMQGYKEEEISNLLGIYQSSVNMRSSSAQWKLLSTAIRNFEDLNYHKICG